MTIKKRKKVVGMRGSKTHGYGGKKRHRGKGSKGGKGMAGSFKHKKTWIFRYDRGHLGKVKGFKSLRQKEIKPRQKSISLRNLDRLVRKNNLSGQIDLESLGYDKLLSGGSLSKPITIKAKCFSKAAAKKVEVAGGKIVQ